MSRGRPEAARWARMCVGERGVERDPGRGWAAEPFMVSTMTSSSSGLDHVTRLDPQRDVDALAIEGAG